MIPTFSASQVIKIKIRRSDWQEGDKWPKYVEVSGSRQSPSLYGNESLSCCLIVESELDALLIQQEAGDIVFCIALGGVTKKPDKALNNLLKNTQLLLFSLDFDEPGKKAYAFWRSSYFNLKAWPVPETKSPGDAFLHGINLREWISQGIEHYGQIT